MTIADGVSVAGPYLIMGLGTAASPYQAYLADVNDDDNLTGGADIAGSPESAFNVTDLSASRTPIGNFVSEVYNEASSSGSGEGGFLPGLMILPKLFCLVILFLVKAVTFTVEQSFVGDVRFGVVVDNVSNYTVYEVLLEDENIVWLVNFSQ